MDLQSQASIARLADFHGPADLVVLLGAPDPESAEIAAETVVLGHLHTTSEKCLANFSFPAISDKAI